jgi:hypothetical protein
MNRDSLGDAARIVGDMGAWLREQINGMSGALSGRDTQDPALGLVANGKIKCLCNDAETLIGWCRICGLFARDHRQAEVLGPAAMAIEMASDTLLAGSTRGPHFPAPSPTVALLIKQVDDLADLLRDQVAMLTQALLTCDIQLIDSIVIANRNIRTTGRDLTQTVFATHSEGAIAEGWLIASSTLAAIFAIETASDILMAGIGQRLSFLVRGGTRRDDRLAGLWAAPQQKAA